MVLKRRKMVCGGLMPGMKAYDIHLYLVCAWSVSVRSTSVAGVWRVDTCGEDEATLLNLKGSSAVHSPYLMRVMTKRNCGTGAGMGWPGIICRNYLP